MASDTDYFSDDGFYSDGDREIASESDGDSAGYDALYYDHAISERSQRKNCAVLNEAEIRKLQAEDIAGISTILSVPTPEAIVLLLRHNWSVSKLQEEWFSDEGKVRKACGLFDAPVVQFQNLNDVTCGICFDDHPVNAMPTASCGHPFCKPCWRGYISTAIMDGPGCLTLRCPDPSCDASINGDMIGAVLGEEFEALKEKYRKYLLCSYVECTRKIKWCPGPGCDLAIEYVIGSGNYDVSCSCLQFFCWNCTEEAHRPVDCSMVAKWIAKNNAESENTNWILAYTKPCPKCKRPIEKNHGCMHMTCRPPCTFQFCWLCLADWHSHAQSACNRYLGARVEEKNDDDKKREMAKKSLERYAHYYERWAANHKSRDKAVADLHQARSVCSDKLLGIQCQTSSQVQFITEAWQQIVECRRVLKWTYAYGYYLPENEVAKKQLFEYLQGQAEAGLERLHVCAEKELQKYIECDGPSEDFNAFRSKLTGLTTVTRNYFENLVRALENGLADVPSQSDNGDLGDTDCVPGSSKRKIKTGNLSLAKKERGRGEAATSRLADYSIQLDGWACDRCTFVNVNSEHSCRMCHGI